MARQRLSGHVRPVRREGREVRGLWALVVALPAEVQADGSRRYPKTQRTVQASGKREAERLLGDWIRELEDHACSDPRRLTIGSLCDQWLEAVVHEVRPKTLDFYRGNVRRHVRPALGEVLAVDLRPSDLTRLYAEKMAAGLSETSCHHIHATIRVAYSWGLREELVQSNPAERVKRPPRQQARAVAVWDQETILRALSLADGLMVQVPLVLAAWAGLRVGEVCGLQWSDVDLEAGLLVVRRAIEATDDGALVIVPPKSEAGLRVVPLPAMAASVLRSHQERQEELRRAWRGRWNREGWVVATVEGRMANPDTVSSAWGRFVRTRKLPPITFHGLRHSYATDLFSEGDGMLKIVQERLGHADPATTARVYLHVTEEASAAAVAEQERRIEEAAARLAAKEDPVEALRADLDAWGSDGEGA